MDWYALFVETGKEEYVQKYLEFQFTKHTLYSIVPKRKLTERKGGKLYHVLRIMFPGYVLVKAEMNAEIYRKIKDIPMVMRILNNGTYYSRIDEEEISPILKLIGETQIIDYSKVYVQDSKVFVKSGPLVGMEGIICRLNTRKNRAMISLNFINTPKVFDVGIEILERIY